MIVVDTSALIAIALQEPAATSLSLALAGEDLLISAATLAEVLIVAGRRGAETEAEMARLIDELGMEIVPVTIVAARAAARAYGRWGKGVHPAALNFGDCFSYALAKERGCALAYIGTDFARTDIPSALDPAGPG